MTEPNPLLKSWVGPHETPEFGAFRAEQFLAAIDSAIAESRGEIAAITSNPGPPTFENTVAALERGGATLARIRRIFWMLSSAQSDDALRAIELAVSERLSQHGTEISHDAALFARIRDVWGQRGRLGAEQSRLVDRSYKGFISGGAALAGNAKARFAEIDARLSALSVKFGQNVMAATNACKVVLQPDEIEGLPQDLIDAGASQASQTAVAGSHAFTLDRGVFETLLTFADSRPVRERVWRAFTGRCQGGEHDNLPIIAEVAALRQERAALLGHDSYASYALEDSMAMTPEAAKALMLRVWTPAVVQAEREEAALLQSSELGQGERLEAWDWRFYSDRVRRQRYAFDGAVVRQHLMLDKVRDAAFSTASRLYGLQFDRREDIEVYHPDVSAWAVSAQSGEHVGVLFTDYLARPEKHGGAWMGSLRVQEKLDQPVRPIVYMVANFACDAEGEALLTIDEARTLFHEFGHALHALLSDVTYPSLAGTAVARDFVEFPSKLMEHWVVADEALRQFGIAEELITAIDRAAGFGQGFATVEFLASALIDLELHSVRPSPTDIAHFEESMLSSLGAPRAIGMRHKLAYFTHVFDGGYASSYYSYLWSEVLDADVFEAFEQSGDIFDLGLADKFRREILAPGDSRDPMTSFIAFRGREPDEGALLRARCLA